MNNFKYKISITNIYIFIIIICLIEAIIYIFLFNGNGNYFYIGASSKDPGGDFYLSLLYSSKLNPYVNIFPYPPIIVIICYLIRFITHDAITLNADPSDFNDSFLIYSKNFDYRNMYFLLTIILFIALFYIIYIFFRDNEKNEVKLFLLSILSLANSGLLCGLVRGNLLLQCLFCLLLFCVTYNKNEKVFRYISIISLAIAFNIKPYAAIFGVLYLYNRNYRDAILCSILSLVVFILPFFYLKGGFLNNIILFVDNLKSFGNNIAISMFGIYPFICTILNKLNILQYNDKIIKLIVISLSIIINILLFISGIKTNKHWKKILSVTLILILLPTNFGYILSFLLLPIIFFLRDEFKLTKSNFFVLGCFLILTAPFYIAIPYSIQFRCLIGNIVLIILTIWLIYDSLIYNN